MRRAVPFVLIGSMAIVIVFLGVTLRRRFLDRARAAYEGSRTPLPTGIAEPAPEWLPETIRHDCPRCGMCAHKLGPVRQCRTLKLQAHYPWNKVLWPADDVWYYGDGVHLAAAMSCPTARDPSGEWTVEFSYPSPHACSGCAAVSKSNRARFSLAFADTELPAAPARRLPCGISIPETGLWFVFRYESESNDRLRHFFWRLDEVSSE